MIAIYQTATIRFLKDFEFCWNKLLTSLNNAQKQLLIGNRLRPQICLWGYLSTIHPNDVSTHDYSQIANIAISIEMVHKASLLLDDWIDGDEKRHGSPTFHTENTEHYTVLFALNLIGQALERLSNIFSDDLVLPQNYQLCLNSLIKTIASMAQGALRELQLKEYDFFNIELIQEISRLETSEIIGNSFLIGYYTGAKDIYDSKVSIVFKTIGEQCGYLFQGFNDLEAFSNSHKLEMHKGHLNMDITVNRKNLAIAMLFSLADKKDQELLCHLTDASTLLKLIKKYRIIEVFTRKLQIVYDDILLSIKELQNLQLPTIWCKGLQYFFSDVKQFAEKRLKT